MILSHSQNSRKFDPLHGKNMFYNITYADTPQSAVPPRTLHWMSEAIRPSFVNDALKTYQCSQNGGT